MDTITELAGAGNGAPNRSARRAVLSFTTMVRGFFLVAFLSLAVDSAPSPSLDEREEKLPEPYRKWLREEVTYIITRIERETFLSLQSEVEREAFVDAFWRKRDTNPSTPENEYRTEHYERLEYANEFLGRDTFKEGWQTDRGRYYILLGKPNTRYPLEANDAIYPSELWFYNDAQLKYVGLPPFFYLLFFRRHGSGELGLYSPLNDGPEALLTGYQTQSRDFRDGVAKAYEKLFEISPELAHASLSFRTDEGDVAQFQNPSFGTLSLLDDVEQSPFHGLDTSYAERLDFERGNVESDYLFTYVPSFGVMNVLPGPNEAYYLHWVVELDAQQVSFVRDEDRGTYSSLFVASVEIAPVEDENLLVFDQRKESFVTLTEAQAKSSLQLPFAYSGMTPLIPGAYRARIVLRNRACPSREESDCIKSYTLFESTVNVPEWQSEKPELSELILSYGAEPMEGEPQYRPFRWGKVEILPNPRGVYAIGDALLVATEPRNAPPGARLSIQVVEAEGERKAWIEKTVSVAGLDERAGEPVVQELSLAGLEGGRFDLVATLLDAEGRERDRKTSPFTVSPRTSIPRPGVRGSIPPVRPELPGVVPMILGEQFLRIGRKEEARALLSQATRENPRLPPARELLAGLLLDAGEVDGVVELLEPVYRNAPDRVEVLPLLGQAYFHQKQYAKSTEVLEKAIASRRPETQLLNMLAVAHHELGNDGRAMEILEQSLSLDSEQPTVRDLLVKLKGGKTGASPRS